MAEILGIAIVAVTIALIILLRGWVRAPAAEIMRARKVGLLWDERERLRGAIAQHKLTHWEKTVLEDRLKQINEDLAALGVPRESLQ